VGVKPSSEAEISWCGARPSSEAEVRPRGTVAGCLMGRYGFLGHGPLCALGRDHAECVLWFVGLFTCFYYFRKKVLSPVIRGPLWLSLTSESGDRSWEPRQPAWHAARPPKIRNEWLAAAPTRRSSTLSPPTCKAKLALSATAARHRWRQMLLSERG
jgi:hypothetical protein